TSRQSPTATICEVEAASRALAARAEECASPLLRSRFIPIWPALRWERFDILRPGLRTKRALFVARDRGQLVEILQQHAAALQIEDAVLAPGLQLAVHALARRADEDAELFLRDVHLRSEIGGERAEAAGQPNRQRLEHRFLHPLALPADALAQQLDDLD